MTSSVSRWHWRSYDNGPLPGCNRLMDKLTALGLFAATAMLVCYVLEDRSHWFILAFAGACALASPAGDGGVGSEDETYPRAGRPPFESYVNSAGSRRSV
jgi:hypothetical protein